MEPEIGPRPSLSTCAPLVWVLPTKALFRGLGGKCFPVTRVTDVQTHSAVGGLHPSCDPWLLGVDGRVLDTASELTCDGSASRAAQASDRRPSPGPSPSLQFLSWRGGCGR